MSQVKKRRSSTSSTTHLGSTPAIQGQHAYVMMPGPVNPELMLSQAHHVNLNAQGQATMPISLPSNIQMAFNPNNGNGAQMAIESERAAIFHSINAAYNRLHLMEQMSQFYQAQVQSGNAGSSSNLNGNNGQQVFMRPAGNVVGTASGKQQQPRVVSTSVFPYGAPQFAIPMNRQGNMAPIAVSQNTPFIYSSVTSVNMKQQPPPPRIVHDWELAILIMAEHVKQRNNKDKHQQSIIKENQEMESRKRCRSSIGDAFADDLRSPLVSKCNPSSTAHNNRDNPFNDAQTEDKENNFTGNQVDEDEEAIFRYLSSTAPNSPPFKSQKPTAFNLNDDRDETLKSLLENFQ